MGSLIDTAQTYGQDNTEGDKKRYSQGNFASATPDADNLCTVPKLSDTRVVIPELPPVEDDPATEEDESFPGQPAVDVTLTWSNIKVFVTASITGTEFQADLVDVRKTPGGETCTIRYRAIGLAPAVATYRNAIRTQIRPKVSWARASARV
jgi:hypothetical protein